MGTVALVGAVQTNADSATGWAGGGLEGELSYQGTGSYGGKAGSGTTRFAHTGTARNFSVGGGNEGEHIIVILGSLTPGKLDTKVNGGLGITAGNDATNYGEWYVDGSDTKSPTSLFLPYIVDPASDFDVAAGTITTTGNPAQLSAADYFGGRFTATSGIMGNFNNALVDQITVGSGLQGTGTGGSIAEWITADEGTTGNRYGFLTTREGVVYMQGKMYFGTSGSSYVFSDTDKVIIFPDVTVASDFFEIIVENASSDVTFDGFTIQAPGTPKVALTYTSGTWLITNSTVDGARVVTGGSGLSITDSKLSNSGQIDLNGMTLSGTSIIGSTAASAVLVNATSDMTNVSEVSFAGSTGHSIELTAAGTYTFTSVAFSGGGADGTTTADVYNNSGGAVTINIVGGGDTPTIRNAASSTTTVNNAVPIELTNLVAGSRVWIRNTTDGVTLFNEIEATATFTKSVNFGGEKALNIRIRNASGATKWKSFQTGGTLTANGFTAQINQIVDE